MVSLQTAKGKAMLKILTSLNPYLMGGVIAAIMLAWGLGYYQGRVDAQAKANKETVKIVERVVHVRDKTNAMPTGAVYDSLRQWQRD